MSRKYVHLLGYSAAEKGIKEIATEDTFDMGSVDIETMEQDFDDFSFVIPMDTPLLVKPLNNEAWLVKTYMNGYTDDVNIKLTGDRQLNVGEYLWIENERIKIKAKNVGGSSITYTISRGENSSIPVVHIPNTVTSGQGDLVATKKRLSPIGLITKIYDSENIYAYGQITGVTLTNSSVAEISCINIYKQMENIVILPVSEGILTVGIGCEYSVNEFYALLDKPNLKVNGHFIGEKMEFDNRYMIYDKTKDSLTQLLNINNSFLRFVNGRFNILYIGRTANKQPNVLKLSDHFAINDGVIEFSLIPPYSSAKINDGVNEEYSIDASDSNFTRAYTLAKQIDLTFDALQIDGDLKTMGREIAIDKLWFLNNVTEMLSISSYKKSRYFEVGEYYSFIDIFKYVSFYDVITDKTFLCISYDDGKVTFIRTPAAILSYIAPSFLCRKIDTQEYEVVNINSELYGDTSILELLTNQIYTNLNDISLMKNLYTDTLVWESGDVITFIDTEGITGNMTIDAITTTSFTTTTDKGATGDFFIVTIQSDVDFSLLATKNKTYLYENNGAF